MHRYSITIDNDEFNMLNNTIERLESVYGITMSVEDSLQLLLNFYLDVMTVKELASTIAHEYREEMIGDD